MSRHSDSTGPKAVLHRIGAALISARARAIMSIGIVLGLGAVGTLAAWSDTATATSGEFKTGFIDIKLDGADTNPTSISTGLTKTNMIPGDTVNASFVVQNQGSVPFSYGISASMTDAEFAGKLELRAFLGSTCTGTAVGARLPLATTEEPLTTGGTNATAALDRPNIAAKVGTNPGQDPLCISVTMPSSATSPQTVRTGTITLKFTATSATV